MASVIRARRRKEEEEEEEEEEEGGGELVRAKGGYDFESGEAAVPAQGAVVAGGVHERTPGAARDDDNDDEEEAQEGADEDDAPRRGGLLQALRNATARGERAGRTRVRTTDDDEEEAAAASATRAAGSPPPKASAARRPRKMLCAPPAWDEEGDSLAERADVLPKRARASPLPSEPLATGGRLARGCRADDYDTIMD